MNSSAMLLLTFAPLFGSLPAHGQVTLEVREIWATRGARAAPFESIAGMIQSPDGRIFVSDDINVAVFAIQPGGSVVQQVVRQGRGPGEVQTPSLMARTTDGHIALWDIGHNVILVLDGAFREIARVRPEFGIYNPKGFAVLPDGSFVLSGGSFRSQFGIHHFSNEGKHVDSWFPSPDVESHSARIHLAGAPVTSVGDGTLLFTRPAPHLIAKLDPASGSITPVAEDSIILPAIGNNFEQKRIVDGREVIAPQWYYPQSRGVYVLHDGAILNIITRRYDHQSTFEIYDSNGKLESRMTAPKAYQPYALTDDGHILASYPDERTDEPVAVLIELRRQ